MSPMGVKDGTPPTQHWVPQSEPLDLDEPLGYHYIHEAQGQDIEVYLEDLDPKVQHRIESWPGAVAILRRLEQAEFENTGDPRQALRTLVELGNAADYWLAANAPEESRA